MEKLMRTLLLAIALTLTTFSSFANDSERITQLENQVNELKLRIQKLENPQSNASNQQKQVVANEGAKSIANWRKLNRGMSYNDVRGLLGEPLRIEGGGVAYWMYSNNGRVTFVRDTLSSWNEPQ
jgi:outer membrane protein assembly factor BamE (lipoprotein component of BamABCDE complex)